MFKLCGYAKKIHWSPREARYTNQHACCRDVWQVLSHTDARVEDQQDHHRH